MPEPNNLAGSELCGVANFTETVQSTGAWGWADVQCKAKNIFICKVMREWRHLDFCVCVGCVGGLAVAAGCRL